MEGLDHATGEEQHGILGGVLEQVHDAILGSLTRSGARRSPSPRTTRRSRLADGGPSRPNGRDAGEGGRDRGGRQLAIRSGEGAMAASRGPRRRGFVCALLRILTGTRWASSTTLPAAARRDRALLLDPQAARGNRGACRRLADASGGARGHRRQPPAVRRARRLTGSSDPAVSWRKAAGCVLGTAQRRLAAPAPGDDDGFPARRQGECLGFALPGLRQNCAAWIFMALPPSVCWPQAATASPLRFPSRSGNGSICAGWESCVAGPSAPPTENEAPSTTPVSPRLRCQTATAAPLSAKVTCGIMSTPDPGPDRGTTGARAPVGESVRPKATSCAAGSEGLVNQTSAAAPEGLTATRPPSGRSRPSAATSIGPSVPSAPIVRMRMVMGNGLKRVQVTRA